MIVVDASVLVVALVDSQADGDAARLRLLGETIAAPEIIDLEVASVLRRQVSQGMLEERRAADALCDLAALPLTRAPHAGLLTRCWELRQNVTIDDGAYVALAEELEATLLTADARLARAAGPRCPIEVLSPI